MGEHRRRVQRLTLEEELQQAQVQSIEEENRDAEAPQTAQESAAPRHRRRAQPQMPADHEAAEEKPIPASMYAQPESADRQKKSLKKPRISATRLRAAAPRVKKEDLKKAAEVSARAGKTALEGFGGLLLLAMMAVSTGAGKLAALLAALRGRIAARGKTEKAPTQQHAAAAAYELEMIRPEDYHGRGQAHAEKYAQKKPHPKTAAGTQRGRIKADQIISIALLCVAVFSAWQIGSIVLRSMRTHRLNEELSQQRAAAIQSEDDFAVYAEPLQSDAQPEQPAEEPPAQAEPAAGEAQETPPEATPSPVPVKEPDVVVSTQYRRLGGEALAEMAQLYERNRDLVAWIQIPDVLDLPVVYRDNDYYLTRDFEKKKNASGTIFLDVNHPFKEKTQNLLLHGHNMKDGTMFGRLAQYLHDNTYLRNHPFIYFDTLWDKEQYVIFAVLNVSLDPRNERFFNYFTHDTFTSDAQFESYIRQLQLRSSYAIPIDVQPGDALLTLSTCLDDDRLVIVCRRLRENETRSQLRERIRTATRQ